MPIVYSTKYQSALQKSGVQNSSEVSIAQMPRQSNNINRLLLSAFRKGGGDKKDLTLMMMMMMMMLVMMMMMVVVMLMMVVMEGKRIWWLLGFVILVSIKIFNKQCSA